MYISDQLRNKIQQDFAAAPLDGSNELHVSMFLDGYMANLQSADAANNKDEAYAVGYLASIKRFGYLRALYPHKVTKKTVLH